MPNYVLHYFNSRGRAEVIRVLFHAGNIPFTDNRISNVTSNAPLGHLPYLEVDGIRLTQSHAIARFVAREANLAGHTSLEQAQADAVVDTCADALNLYFKKVIFSHNQNILEVEDTFNRQFLPKHLENIEKLIKLYGQNGYAVGNSLTWADIYINETIDQLRARATTGFATLYPMLNRNLEKISQHPRVKPYYESNLRPSHSH